MPRVHRVIGFMAVCVIALALACSFSPTAPFEGFDGMGSRVSGTQVSLGECARSPGFWCQNQDGKNPNLNAARFEELAGEAAGLLTGVAALDTPEEIRLAVCNTSDQLIRHLGVLALNLEARLVEEGTLLIGENYDTVGEAFDAAIAAANGNGSRDEVNAVKDVLDRINNNRNTGSACTPDDDSSDDSSGDDDSSDDKSSDDKSSG